MLAAMRNYAQSLANSMMTTPVTIRHRAAPGKDPTNKSGDDIIEFDPVTTSAMGWYVSSLTKSFTQDGAMSTVTEQDIIRFPVGTDVKERDEILLAGEWWIAADASQDETWPAMVKVSIVRQG